MVNLAAGAELMWRDGHFLKKTCFCTLIIFVLLTAAWAEDRPGGEAIKVTVADLARDPAKFDGRFIRVDALLVYGFEGDDFLSDPTADSAQLSPRLFLYCKRENDKYIADAFKFDSARARFAGIFHFVPNHRANAMFDPGPLQLEAIGVLDARPSTSLSHAIRSGDIAAATKLIHAGVKLNVIDEYWSFPLWHASEAGSVGLVEDLLSAGADPNFSLPSGDTAIHAAARNCKLGVAKLLIAHGADVNTIGNDGETALILSSQTCADGKMTQVLLDAGADVNARSKDGGTALRAAARNPIVAEKLLKAGADPAAKDKYGNTAESESCDRGAEGFYRVCQLVRAALGKNK